jgi:hypothetical protein
VLKRKALANASKSEISHYAQWPVSNSRINEVLPVIPNPTDLETVAMAEITVVGSNLATCDPPLYWASFVPR